MRATRSALTIDSKIKQCRQLSVAGWGMNNLGQVGEGLAELHAEPCVLGHLEGEDIAHVAAGTDHSAAVGTNGAVWSWGCGLAGRLGHGDSGVKIRPQRMESLLGRADIGQIALGSEHSLLIDKAGLPFSCGSNSKGQSRDVLEKHLKKELEQRVGAENAADTSQDYQLVPGSRRLSSAMQSQSMLLASQIDTQTQLLSSHRTLPDLRMESKQTEVKQIWSMLDESGQDLQWQALAYQAVNPDRFESLPAAVSLTGALSSHQTSVISASASGSYSAMITSEGKIAILGHTVPGGDKNSSPQRATNLLAELQKQADRLGGATCITAADTFCAVLTVSGKVLLCGRWPSLPGFDVDKSLACLTLEKLSGITHIAAGAQHLVLSDSQRIWSIGLWQAATGSVIYDHWDSPRLMTTVSGVRQLAAGSHTSAVVDDANQLHLWGRLVSKGDLHRAKRVGRNKMQQPSYLWEGLGSDLPAQVSGLGEVHSVALGHKHALALVDA